ncbi:hypothetical protein N7507_000978 [Penicillium longicatenatum]|nr:hypothetical protein N7507_000978 [Penicillium longicatenatum]
MPALLEDPASHNPPPQAHIQAANTLTPRHTTLPKSDSAAVTLYPITNGPSSIPQDLVKYLHAEFSAEIERGTTYPMEKALGLQQFAEYWFGTFAVVAILDDEGDAAADGLREGRDWAKVCLGTFYIKPNYPGRCSHICNAGFITTNVARGKGVGFAMGETYLEFAPKLVRIVQLYPEVSCTSASMCITVVHMIMDNVNVAVQGYKYSVFNLVFANNPASIRIWERLGFSVIGRVPKAGRLDNSEELVDALIFGRELGN